MIHHDPHNLVYLKVALAIYTQSMEGSKHTNTKTSRTRTRQQIMTMTKQLATLSMTLLFMMYSSMASAFLSKPAFLATPSSQTTRHSEVYGGSRLSMMIDSPSVESLGTVLFHMPTTILAAASYDPDIEAEVLVDVSHVIMDLPVFFRPSESLVRCFSVIGRILVIGADYLPDHTMHPEELAIQLFLLGISLKDVLKAVHLHGTQQAPQDRH